jgi:arachidonate 15-lipoxygenase
MSQLHSFDELDFDYERFPGIALRATDKPLRGHMLINRPRQVVELARRIAILIGHVLKLAGSRALLTSTSAEAVLEELKALAASVNALEALKILVSPSPSEPEIQEATDAAEAALPALLNLLSLLQGKWKQPNSLEWYGELFTKGTIDAPQPVSDFLYGQDRNRVFASWWVQGNNPLCVSGVTLDEIKAAVGTLDSSDYARVMGGDTPQAADRDHRLFWVDFPTLLTGLEPGNFPVRKRLPKPRVLFAVKPECPADEPFVPLAIFDDWTKELVWSDSANANAWTRAMLAAMCANQLHHTFVTHFPRTHFVMEAVAVATLRTLEESKHPLFWLLRTHIDGTLAFNETALSSFTAEAGADRFLMATSLRTGQAVMRRSLDEWKDYHFPNDLDARRVKADQLPYYPYRDDAQLWWDAIGRFVSGVVAAGYDDDAAVRNDRDLQSWANILVAKRTPAAQGAELIRAAPATRAELEGLLHKLIFTCTAYHAAVQVPLNGFDVSPLTAPCALYPDDPSDPPESMLADLGTSLFQLAFFYFGDVITENVGTYAVTTRRIPSRMQTMAAEFPKALPTIKNRIDGANSQQRRNVGAYEPLLPEKVSRSVDI